MTGVVEVHTGARVSLEDGEVYTVVAFRAADIVLLEHRTTFRRKSVGLQELRPVPQGLDDSHDVSPEAVTDKRWEQACAKHDAVQRVLAQGGSKAAVESVAAEEEVHLSTVYRWLSDYRQTGRVADLFRKTRSDVGRPRIGPRQEAMIRRVIRDYYLSLERPGLKATHTELDRRCKLKGLRTPSIDTLKSRIAMCPTLEAAEARGQTRLANKLRLNRGTLEGANFPYALVQIDHTLVDIQLVDGERRLPIGRPWITVAIDVFSRMCIGFYISFDSPGMLGTGLCLTHAIRNKTAWMARLGLDYDYPCQGIPGIVHTDNAKEFRGNTLKIVCDLHRMDLQFRKVKKPRYGAHIERLMGTLLKEIHTLPGTTFSNVQQKEDYDSEGRSIFTLAAFERWLAHLILGVYHNRPHSGLNDTPPLMVFKRALVTDSGLPTGNLRIETDEERLYMDFLPGELLSVQQYGIQWDKIQYSGDVLRRWVGSRNPDAPTKARKFFVKRDPRDISAVFFKDPETDQYFRIPYRNLANPRMSMWELRRVRKYLKDKKRREVDEAAIMAARNEMAAIHAAEQDATDAARRKKKSKRYTRETRETRRRSESPQPEFGQAAPGRPQVLASQDALASPKVPASLPTAPVVPSSPKAPEVSLPEQTRGSDRTRTAPPAAPAAPAAPFDEIEDY